jgi:glycosyltransferase involved in cell wall biosynthesis
MIGVVIPAHNEEALIGVCLESIAAASQCLRLQGESVRVIVVCDHCSDGTRSIAENWKAETLDLAVRNVGQARAAGAEMALRAGARWLAFTDADTQVSPQWLSEQLALDVDAVCGTIGVVQWSVYGRRMKEHFSLTYTDRDGHRHVHGANLGVSAKAYRLAGGFEALASGEDVALVDALQRSGARIAWSARPRVTTSARADFRAPDGFGATLSRIERECSWAGHTPVAT